MLEFLRPIVIFDVWIYIFLGIIALFFARGILLARKDRSRSIFTLERENANTRVTRAFIGFMVILGFMLGVYYLSLTVPPILPTPPDTPTPTPIIGLPPTPTSPPLLLTPTPTNTPLPLPSPPTFAAFEESTVQPTPPPPPPVQSSGCPNPGSVISQPGNGAQVAGIVQVFGTANIDNFDYYKFEFRRVGTGGWNFWERFDHAVPSGALGTWNSDTVAPGEYEFRLVVVDAIGNFPEPCVVRLNVQ
jgi:hypothetical protein